MLVLVFVQILLSIFAVLSSTIVICFGFISLINDADALQGMLVDYLRCISDTFVRSRCISFEMSVRQRFHDGLLLLLTHMKKNQC
jgi:hypothetical protein